MTLIKCDSDCRYQKDGYCTNDKTEYSENIFMPLSSVTGCLYYNGKKPENGEKVTAVRN